MNHYQNIISLTCTKISLEPNKILATIDKFMVMSMTNE